ncbi:hypothetical protein SJI45_19160 [Streptomyces sp. S399]|uniref:hypothetical protein n=1 Tax=Streptomyces sp. S399 TaxID=3096009 RepID=UPI002A812FC9|nr:hypothetical protein [Streptomyces sp. S399]WPR52857.1 hypothetical protein SJI45_19160 [Streptomyces sp. S399]
MGCSDIDKASPPYPSRTYTGPEAEAYQAGYQFGKPHRDDAHLQRSDMAVPDSDSLSDALQADLQDYQTWCGRNLPNDLKIEHSDHRPALRAGCVAGLSELYHHPERYQGQ